MRTTALLLLLLGAAAGYSPAVEENSGFLLTLPHSLRQGSEDDCRYRFNLFNFPGPVRRMRLRFSTDDKYKSPLFSVVKEVAEDKPATTIDCLGVPVPHNITDTKARVEVTLETSSGVVYTDEGEVTLKEHKPPITLSTQDKPQYRPGDHAHFQLTTLYRDLRPAGGPGNTQTIPEVWVTDPAGVRVAQWRNTPVTYGVARFHLHLAEEITQQHPKLSGIYEDGFLATWKIHYKAKNFYQVEEFTVGEVASPPVFNVDITAPTSLGLTQRTITVGVCASYLFEKPLIGANVSVEIKIERPRWDTSEYKGSITYAKTKSTGCALVDLFIDQSGEYQREVVVKVNVTDTASGATEKREISLIRSHLDTSLTLLHTFDFIQAKLSRTLKYRAVHLEGDPAVNETVKICLNSRFYRPIRTSESAVHVPGDVSPFSDYSFLLPASELEKLSPDVKKELSAIPLFWKIKRSRENRASDCREVRTDGEGVAKIQLTQPAERVHEINVEASINHFRHSIGTFDTFQVMTSPSHSYLALDLSHLPVKLPCSGELALPLLTTVTEDMPVVQLQVLARGSVVAHEVTNSSHPLEFTLHMRPEMSPEVRLVVYSQLASGEVMADSAVLPVETCFPNEVTASWEESKVAPGGEVSVNIAAAPFSQCTVSVKDAGLGLRKRGRQPYELTPEKTMAILSELDRFTETPPLDLDNYCEGLQSKLFTTLLRAGVDESSLTSLRKGFSEDFSPGSVGHATQFIAYGYADASDAFRHAGLVPFANIGVRNAPCIKAEVYRFGGRRRRHVRRHRVARSGGAQPPHLEHDEESDVRVDNREEVIYHSTHTLDEHGSANVPLDLPGQVSSWVASAVCMHPQKGLGISKKVSLSASKLLFAKMTMPHSIKYGEELTVPVTVFNNYDSPLSVHVSLDTLEYVHNADGSTGSDGHPAGYALCIASHRSEAVRWPLRFLRLGATNVSVTVEERSGYCAEPNTVHPRRETIIKEIVIRPEGFLHEDVTSHFVCLDSGESRTVEVDLLYPHGLVNGSAWLYASVFGDLLEPSRLNLESKVRQPAYGAEPNMLDVVPNVYIHEYFLATNLMTTSLKRQTENNIRKGLRTALRYRREDGSFSSHGDQDDEGSLWLTVLTIKTFNDAAKLHPNVAIQLGEFGKSAEWVMKQQQKDGCFRPVGELLHQDLRGGVEKHDTGLLTAYVILALHDVIEKHRLLNGLRCMESYVRKPDTSLYTKILVAYTYLQMGLESRGRQMVNDLLAEATTEGDNVLYWHGNRSTPVYGLRPVADLEMTSYMTLALIQLSGADNLLTANKAVKWIISQRDNTLFKSPQAVAASLQALSAFARRTYSSETQSTISVTVGDLSPFFVHVNAENRLLQQRYKVKDVQLPTKVLFKATAGCVTLQTGLRYASHSEVPNPAFSLFTEAKERQSSAPGSTFSILACAKSTALFGHADKASMAIELPSGFVAVRSSLRNLRYNGEIEAFGIDESGVGVMVTLVDITRESKCFTFRIVRANEVDNLQPSVVTIFDVYEPQRKATLEYTLQNTLEDEDAQQDLASSGSY